MIAKIIGRVAPGWTWLSYLSFFTPFEPQPLVGNATKAWSLWIPRPDGAAGARWHGL